MQYFASALTGSSLSLARQPAARHQGVLPAHAPAARGGSRAFRRLPRRASRADRVVMAFYEHVARRLGGARSAALHAACDLDRARARLPVVRDQRPLPRRAVHDPGLPPGPPVALGRHVRGRVDPGEVAVDPLAQPDDGSDQRVALGSARRDSARHRPGRPQRLGRGRCCSSSASRCSGRRSHASRTRSDGDRDRRPGARQALPDRRASGCVRDASGVALACRETVLRARRAVARREEIWALRDVSFEVQQGEVLGVIGRNGAGKSTLLKVLTRITSPTAGRAEIRGRVGSLLGGRDRLPPRADGAREHLPERCDPGHEAPRDPAEAARDRRLLRGRLSSSTRR